MSEYKCIPLGENVEEMFIGPFGSSLKNECFVDEDEAYCMVYEQKHAIQKTMDVETRYVNEQKYNELKRFNIQGGDIIVSCRGTIGETFIVPDDAPLGIMHPSIMKIRLKDGIYDKYYFNLLLMSRLKKHEAAANGSGIKMAISATELGKELFPVPTMLEQQEITDIISKVSDVIGKRKQELFALDDLIKARFVELFGNPLDGTAKYPIHQVGNVAESVDPQPSHRTPPVVENGIPYVSIKDCDYKTGTIDFEGARKVSTSVLEEHLKRYTLHDGDFVIGKIGTIGNPVFVPARNDYTLSANVVLVQPNSELVSPYFLKYSFESDFVERQFAEAKNSTSQAAFGIQKVRTVEVMNPDIEVQREFEQFVKQVDKSKIEVQKSLDETLKLFDSLMQEYFG